MQKANRPSLSLSAGMLWRAELGSQEMGGFRYSAPRSGIHFVATDRETGLPSTWTNCSPLIGPKQAGPLTDAFTLLRKQLDDLRERAIVGVGLVGSSENAASGILIGID